MLSEVRRRGDELVDLWARVIRIPTENPPGDTTALVEFLERYLGERGIATTRHEPRAGMPNLVGGIGRGRRNLVLASHLDEFPAGSGWTMEPFSGVVRDGRMYGRGAGDMKAGLAVSVFLTTLLHGLQADLQGRLTVVFASDEETGGTWGTQWLLDHVEEARGDACLIGESSGTWSIGIGEKGVLWLRVRAAGVSGHAAYRQGESAVVKMLDVLREVSRLDGRRARLAPEVAGIVRRQRRAAEAHWGQGAGALADRLSINVGVIRGGGQVNLIPAACEAEIDVRLPPGLTVVQVEEEVRQRVAALGAEGVEIEATNRCDAHVTSPEEPLVQALVHNSSQVLKVRPLPVIRLGYTDGRLFRRRGIPTAVYGPRVTNMGGPDESVDVEELLGVAAVHAGAIVDYLGGE